VTRDRLEQFMASLAGGRTSARVYLVGGATAVLLGWRDSTVDVDVKLDQKSFRSDVETLVKSSKA